MIRVFLAAFLFVVVATQAAEKPTLAIINGTSSPEAADLLLSKLSAGGEFAFVERARLAEVVKEQRLSSMSRESNVRTGQLLGAEALLFVEADRELLHVRLVETSRGGALVRRGLPGGAGCDAGRGRRCAAGWPRFRPGCGRPRAIACTWRWGRSPPFRSTVAFRESLATLATLIGVRLSQQERVLVVERENLAAVGGEQALTGKTAADLRAGGRDRAGAPGGRRCGPAQPRISNPAPEWGGARRLFHHGRAASFVRGRRRDFHPDRPGARRARSGRRGRLHDRRRRRGSTAMARPCSTRAVSSRRCVTSRRRACSTRPMTTTRRPISAEC